MADKYNVFNSVDKIYDNKVKYMDSLKKQGKTAAEKYAENAKKYYSELRSNGYSGTADELAAADVPAAEKIRSYYGKSQKTAIRPYLSKLAGQYNDSKGSKIDINKYLGYDETTGEVSLGGRNIGRPYSEVDGTTYWDADDLNRHFKTFVNDIGASMNDKQAYNSTKMKSMDYIDSANSRMNKEYDTVNDERKKISDIYHSLYDESMNMNPFDTDWGKALMQRYTSKGANAANKAAASTAGTNGGNIDSFAAANAARQNLAFENAGSEAVLNMYNSKISNAYNILQGLGIAADSMRTDADSRFKNNNTSSELAAKESQRYFDNNETALNGEVSRDDAISGITGYIDPKYLKKYNPYFDEDGNVNTDIDYKAEIDRLTAENKALDEENAKTDDASLRESNNKKAEDNRKKINAAEFARSYKVQIPEYSRYAAGSLPFEREETADVRNEKSQLESAERMTTAGYRNVLDKAEIEGRTAISKAAAEGQSALEVQKAKNEGELAAIDADGRNSMDQLKYMAEKGVNKNGKTEEQKTYEANLAKNEAKAVKEINEYLELAGYGEEAVAMMADGTYYAPPDAIDKIIKKASEIKYLSDSEMRTLLLKMGFTEEQLKQAEEDFKNK